MFTVSASNSVGTGPAGYTTGSTTPSRLQNAISTMQYSLADNDGATWQEASRPQDWVAGGWAASDAELFVGGDLVPDTGIPGHRP